MNVYELRAKIEATHDDSLFFSPNNMKFGGDTMRNYGVRGPLKFKTNDGELCEVYELFRRRATRKGMTGSAYFRADDFSQTWGKIEPTVVPDPESLLVELRALIARGLTFGDTVNAFAEKRTALDAVYVAAAKVKHETDEGDIEVDDSAQVSISSDGGAYVMAWTWTCIYDDEKTEGAKS